MEYQKNPEDEYYNEPWPDQPEEAPVWDPAAGEYRPPGTTVGLSETLADGTVVSPTSVYGEGNPLATGIYYQGGGEESHRPWSTVLFVMYIIGAVMYMLGMFAAFFAFSALQAATQNGGTIVGPDGSTEVTSSALMMGGAILALFFFVGLIAEIVWIVLWRIGMKRADGGRKTWLKVMSIIAIVFATLSTIFNTLKAIGVLFGSAEHTPVDTASASLGFAFSLLILYLCFMLVKNLFKNTAPETARPVDGTMTVNW